MVETPGDKIDPDEYDDVGEYIADAMAEGYTIEAEDFEGRPCAYCGEMIPFVEWPENVVMWDTEVQDMETGEKPGVIVRTYFCSEECKSSAVWDEEFVRNGSEYQDPDRIDEDQLEAHR